MNLTRPDAQQVGANVPNSILPSIKNKVEAD